MSEKKHSTLNRVSCYLQIIMRNIPYYFYFYYLALKGLCRKQNIKLTDKELAFSKPYFFSNFDKTQFDTLFHLPLSNKDQKLTYYWKIYEKFYLQLMDTMKFNYANVLHLEHERHFLNENGLGLKQTYSVEGKLLGLTPLNHDRVIMTTHVVCKGSKGELIFEQIDYIFLKGVTEQQMKTIEQSPLLNHSLPMSRFQSLSKKKAQLDQQPSHDLMFPEYLGIYYGLVSGDLNPVHTSKLFARFFGIKKPFIQGVCTANYILKTLSHDLEQSIKNIQTTFCRPIYLGQKTHFHYDNANKKFELVDKNKKLLALESWK